MTLVSLLRADWMLEKAAVQCPVQTVQSRLPPTDRHSSDISVLAKVYDPECAAHPRVS